MKKPLDIVAADAQQTSPKCSSVSASSKGQLFTCIHLFAASSYDEGEGIFYALIMILLALIFPANWVAGTGIAVYGEHVNDGIVCLVSLYFLALGTYGFTYFVMVLMLHLTTQTPYHERLGKLEARGRSSEVSKPARSRSCWKSSHFVIALVYLHLCPIVLAIFVVYFVDKIPAAFLIFALLQAIVSIIILCLFAMNVSAKGGLYLWKKDILSGAYISENR